MTHHHHCDSGHPCPEAECANDDALPVVATCPLCGTDMTMTDLLMPRLMLGNTFILLENDGPHRFVCVECSKGILEMNR